MRLSRPALHWPLIATLALAAGFRFYGLGHGVGFHPDERHIIMVTQRLGWHNLDPDSFAYGSLPFYLLRLTAGLLSWVWPSANSYTGLFYVGRTLSALAGVANVWLLYLLARRLRLGEGGALAAALGLALAVLPIQLSHFYAVDVLLTTLCTAALLCCVGLAQEDRGRWYALCGVAMGAALAVKISALPLAAPLGVAWLLRCRRRGGWSWRALGALAGAVLLAGLVFLLCEPYALLNHAKFLHDIREQGRMVTGETQPVYVIQYEKTRAYLYPLSQMITYGLGWPLGVSGLLGVALLAYRSVRRRGGELLVLLAWILPVFAIVGGFKVKFMRYLLPLYPFVILAAVVLLGALGRVLGERWGRRWSRLPLVVVLGWTLAQALAFANIYRHPHVWYTASEWMYENLPPGVGVLGEHWDDKLPLSLPGHPASTFRTGGRAWELPLYERDRPEKMRSVAEKLSRAEVIALPTARLYGALLNVPERYPLTARYYRLLFAGRLGYRLVQTFKVYPRLGPLVLRDELADESFTVYDHPKVVIFRKAEELGADELERRLLGSDESGLPDRRAIMLATAGEPLVGPSGGSALWAVAAWFGAIALLGWALWIVLAPLCGGLPDRGYGLSRVLGLFAAAWVSWSCGTLLGFRVGLETSVLAVVVLGGAALGAWCRRGAVVRAAWRDRRREIRRAEILWWTVAAVFLLYRAFHPEIYWGEKPMDMTFLGYFARLESLPPEDPWAAGHLMRYYYFGSYTLGWLTRLIGASPSVTYNLALATLPAMVAVAALGVLSAWTRRLGWATVGALLLVFLGDTEVLVQLFGGSGRRGFDLFWASSRVLTSPAITEYPLWSFLFGDLHAHVIALPLTVCVVAASMGLLDKRRVLWGPGWWLQRLLVGWLVGLLAATNTWDVLVYGGFVGLLVLLRPPSMVPRRPGGGGAMGPLAAPAADGLVIAGAAVLGFWPQWRSLFQGPGGGMRPGFVISGFDTLGQVLRVQGHWLALAAWCLAVVLWRRPAVGGRRAIGSRCMCR